MNKQQVIYAANYITNMLINFDHGIIPACTQEMKRDLQIDDVQLGMLGSAVYGGLVLGSIIGTTLFKKISTRHIVASSVLLCMLSLSLFIFTRSIYLLFMSRFLVGFFQIFLVVYFPVWIDFYGESNKTLWLTFMQLGVALGAVGGYLVTSLFILHTDNWVYPYYLQIIMLLPCAAYYCFFCNDNDLDIGMQKQPDEQLIQPTQPQEHTMQLLLGNPIFLYSMLSLSSLFFVVTGLQFWVSDYMRIVLHMPQHVVFKAYLVISLSAPLIGVMVGGIVLHHVGGYDGANALKVATVEALLASIVATPIPHIDSPLIVMILLWLLFFFGGCAVPAITGIMICSIPKDSRSSGNSISHLFQELLGYLPSPMIYGFIQSQSGGPTSRYGMITLMSWSYFGLIFIALATRSDILAVKLVKEFNPFHAVDFTQLKRQTSLTEAQSAIVHSRSRAMSFDRTQLNKDLHRPGALRRTLKRQRTFGETIFNVASLVSRGSIDVNLQRVREEQNELISETNIEMQEGTKYYMVSSGDFEVKNAHRQAFKEIFSMKAVDGKLDKRGLADLFVMIDYKIPQEQFDEMVTRIYGKKEQIGFEEFLKIFNLKLTDYTFNDVKNAFKLLAKDDDRYIPLEKIKKVLIKNNVVAEEVEFLCHQLDPFTDTMKRVNYQEFLKSLSNV